MALSKKIDAQFVSIKSRAGLFIALSYQLVEMFMKIMIIGSLLLSLSSWAQKAPALTEKEENKVMTRVMEQILNSIDQSAIDLNINGISVDTKDETPLQMDDVRLNGMVSFAGNWQVDLVEVKDQSEKSLQMKKVYPKLHGDAKNLKLAVDLKMVPNLMTLEAKFFSHHDRTKKQWIARPLTIKISNQMNKELLTIRLYSLKAEKKVSTKNPDVEVISGTCQSDKILLDLTTGQNRQVPVDCTFSGTLSKTEGHKLQFRYANKLQ